MSETILNEIIRAVGSVEAKVDGINARLDQQNGRLGKVEGRVGSLEETRSEQRGGWKLLAMFGASSVLSIFASRLWK